MLRVMIFGKKECEACKAMHEKVSFFVDRWNVKVDSIDFIDLDTVEGLAEGAYRDVYDIPTMVIEVDGSEVGRWRKTPPLSTELKPLLAPFMQKDAS